MSVSSCLAFFKNTSFADVDAHWSFRTGFNAHVEKLLGSLFVVVFEKEFGEEKKDITFSFIIEVFNLVFVLTYLVEIDEILLCNLLGFKSCLTILQNFSKLDQLFNLQN